MAATGLRVVAIGSHHGDDRVGWQVLERLAALAPPPARLARCGAPAAELLGLLEGARGAVLVDAVATGGVPGTVGTWRGEAIGGAGAAVSSHGLDVAQVLALGRTLGVLPRRLVLVGITVDPAACAPRRDGLTPAVAAAVGAAARRVAAELAAMAPTPRAARPPASPSPHPPGA